jgi:hypothetical protein
VSIPAFRTRVVQKRTRLRVPRPSPRKKDDPSEVDCTGKRHMSRASGVAPPPRSKGCPTKL